MSSRVVVIEQSITRDTNRFVFSAIRPKGFGKTCTLEESLKSVLNTSLFVGDPLCTTVTLPLHKHRAREKDIGRLIFGTGFTYTLGNVTLSPIDGLGEKGRGRKTWRS